MFGGSVGCTEISEGVQKSNLYVTRGRRNHKESGWCDVVLCNGHSKAQLRWQAVVARRTLGPRQRKVRIDTECGAFRGMSNPND